MIILSVLFTSSDTSFISDMWPETITSYILPQLPQIPLCLYSPSIISNPINLLHPTEHFAQLDS